MIYVTKSPFQFSGALNLLQLPSLLARQKRSTRVQIEFFRVCRGENLFYGAAQPTFEQALPIGTADGVSCKAARPLDCLALGLLDEAGTFAKRRARGIG